MCTEVVWLGARTPRCLSAIVVGVVPVLSSYELKPYVDSTAWHAVDEAATLLVSGNFFCMGYVSKVGYMIALLGISALDPQSLRRRSASSVFIVILFDLPNPDCRWKEYRKRSRQAVSAILKREARILFVVHVQRDCDWRGDVRSP